MGTAADAVLNETLSEAVVDFLKASRSTSSSNRLAGFGGAGFAGLGAKVVRQSGR